MDIWIWDFVGFVVVVFSFGRGGCYELVIFQLLSAVVVYHGYVGCGGMAVDFDDLFCMTLIPPRRALRLFAPSCALRPCAHSRC